MKATRAVGQVAVALLSLSPAVSALSWPNWLPSVDSLVVRADSTSTPTSASQTASPASSATTGSSASEPITTNYNTAGLSATTGTGTGTGTGTSGATSNSTSKTTATSHTTYDAQDPAGSVVMMTPATTSGTQLYRIGEYVTWVWNYTNLQATPTAVDVLVSCSVATETWTLTQNMTFQTLGSYTWDTGAYQSTAIASPLLTEMYTMIVYDAESSISATAEAGYLAAYSGLQFGLYAGRPYTPLSEWVCATCSSAVSDMERRAVGVALIMSIVTVLSFTWFVTGFAAFL